MEQLSSLLLQLNDHLMKINGIVFQMNSILTQMNTPKDDGMNSQISQMNTMITKLNKNNYSLNTNLNLNPTFNTLTYDIGSSLNLEMKRYEFLFYSNLGEKQVITANEESEIKDVLEEFMTKYNKGRKQPVFIYEEKVLTLSDRRKIKELVKNKNEVSNIIVYY